MSLTPPFDLKEWVERNRALLTPPVGNKCLYDQGDLIVMAVGGPNARKDYHHDPGAELFYQLEGEMVLRTIQEGQRVDVPIRAGEMFLLPPEVPHSPQRPAGGVGLVVERRRRADEQDGFSWYCERCGAQLHLEHVPVKDIETQLPEIFARFYANERARTCRRCGAVLQPPA
ncbi:MAG TPA: 3-hydroxyanthranilate 3,4-dioxygenase [Steroidobacteraceae bacterium]|nr:3-hydroxyanthranilate 3,4-dioxygenase [Steroidobacteraceae bacterium]